MLTARSTATSPLDIIRLTLEMLSGGSDVPLTLKEHFNKVLATARTISTNPNQVTPNISPEAIHLAYEILTRTALREELENVTQLDDVDPTRASKLLAEMEQSSVYS